MNICKIDISNFRGIKNASILVSKNAVFVGDNNSGKSTLFEAVDLVMGPDRLSRSPVIDEHDFYAGEYLANDTPVQIKIEVTVIGLSEDQKIYFGNHIEWWDRCKGALISGPPASSTDAESVEPALRLAFQGNYNLEDDDFEGQTYFAETLREGSTPELFRKKDKRNCGFLYLRTLRTGNRALSLERGSLLDIILQMKEVKPQMWEDVLNQLKGVSVANESELGVSDILTSVQDSLSNIVSYEAADKPQIKVSNLTREHLRKVLTVFMGSGAYREDGTEYLTPYAHQGTGTVNTLVLSLLSIIADIKENVIFAMEEPEIALPPHIQKRVISTVIEKSTQALFTSHSPYVIEEFLPDQILVENEQSEVYQNLLKDARHLRLLQRGSQLYAALDILWRENSSYIGATEAVANALTQEHFSMSTRKWSGVNVMTIHKSKGKEFDAVIVYEGRYQNRIISKPERREQATLNLRVAVTRAKEHTYILTPNDDPCSLL